MIKSSELFKIVEKEYEAKAITINHNNKEYVVNIKTKFKPSDIAEIVNDMVATSKECLKANVIFDSQQSLFINLFKKFTDLVKFDKKKDLVSQYAYDVAILDALIDLGWFKVVVDEFEECEMKKIEDMFVTYKDNLKLMAENILAQQHLSEEDGGMIEDK